MGQGECGIFLTLHVLHCPEADDGFKCACLMKIFMKFYGFREVSKEISYRK
jgi:hypothetical protein